MLLTFLKSPLFLYSLVFVQDRFFSASYVFLFYLLSHFLRVPQSPTVSVGVRKTKRKKLPFLSLFMLQSHVLWRLLRLSLSLPLFLSSSLTHSFTFSLSLFQDNKTSHWLLYFIHATFFNSPKQQQTRFLKNVSACQAFFKTYLSPKWNCCAVVTVLYRRTERLPVRLWLERSQMM